MKFVPSVHSNPTTRRVPGRSVMPTPAQIRASQTSTDWLPPVTPTQLVGAAIVIGGFSYTVYRYLLLQYEIEELREDLAAMQQVSDSWRSAAFRKDLDVRDAQAEADAARRSTYVTRRLLQ